MPAQRLPHTLDPVFAGVSCYRGDRTRTCNPRFWRPVLYRLSYSPGLRLPSVATDRGGGSSERLGAEAGDDRRAARELQRARGSLPGAGAAPAVEDRAGRCAVAVSRTTEPAGSSREHDVRHLAPFTVTAPGAADRDPQGDLGGRRGGGGGDAAMPRVRSAACTKLARPTAPSYVRWMSPSRNHDGSAASFQSSTSSCGDAFAAARRSSFIRTQLGPLLGQGEPEHLLHVPRDQRTHHRRRRPCRTRSS